MTLTTRDLAQARQWFEDQGIAISDWSISRGFNPALVYAVLQGRRKCVRGQSHRIAIELQLKHAPVDSTQVS